MAPLSTARIHYTISPPLSYAMEDFLADRTNGRAYATVLRLSSVCL